MRLDDEKSIRWTRDVLRGWLRGRSEEVKATIFARNCESRTVYVLVHDIVDEQGGAFVTVQSYCNRRERMCLPYPSDRRLAHSSFRMGGSVFVEERRFSVTYRVPSTPSDVMKQGETS